MVVDDSFFVEGVLDPLMHYSTLDGHPVPLSHGVARNMELDHATSIAYDASMAKRSKKMTDQLRQAIDDSGLTRYRIAQDADLDESALAKFYGGKRGLSLDNIDRLFEYLGLRIVMDPKPKPKGK